MAQHDYDINSSDSISGLQFRADVNAVLSAIKSSNSGATAPTTFVVGTLWLDTSVSPSLLKKRNTANTGWDTIPIESALATPIASAATTTVGTYSGGNTVHITGVTTITSLGVSTTGTIRTLIFDAILTITHNATSLILPDASSIMTTAGSTATFICEDGALGYWRCVGIMHSSVSMAELLYISTLTSDAQTQLNAKAPLASPTFTGVPAVPTAAVGTSTTQVASTAFVNAEIANDALLLAGGTMTGAITALRETKVAMGANDINLATGNLFTKTISGITTLTVSNWLATGNANSFVLELTNGGAFAVTWFAGVKWASGIAPTLTAAGVDILGFYSHDGGTTVRGIVLAKDSK